VVGFRLRHEGTRARFYYYLDRDVRSFASLDRLAALGPGTTVVTAVRHARVLAADGRFVELRRTRDYVAFRVRAAADAGRDGAGAAPRTRAG